MNAILLILVGLFLVGSGWMLGYNKASETHTRFFLEDIERLKREAHDNYKLGYERGYEARKKDDVLSSVTPNDIREALGFDRIEEFDFVEGKNLYLD